MRFRAWVRRRSTCRSCDDRRARVRRTEVAARAVGLGLRVRARGAHARARAGGGGMARDASRARTSRAWSTTTSTIYDDARRFQINTLPAQDFAGLNASLEMFLELGPESVAKHIEGIVSEAVRVGRGEWRQGAARDAGGSGQARGRARDCAARSGGRVGGAECGEDLSLVAGGGDTVVATLLQYEGGDGEGVGGVGRRGSVTPNETPGARAGRSRQNAGRPTSCSSGLQEQLRPLPAITGRAPLLLRCALEGRELDAR